MSINTILKKAWGMLWQYRALWLFGAILALVGTSLIPFDPSPDDENDVEWIKIQITDSFILKVPGWDTTIDFTAPEGVRITTPHRTSWREFNDLVDELDRDVSINLWPILIELIAILSISLLLGLVARYVAETAVIRMVNESEETGKRLSVRDGLRSGFSRQAGRLFLLDLIISTLAVLAFSVVFGLAVTPILLAIGSHEAILITVGVGTLGLLILAGYLWMAAIAVLSLVLQPIRRACVLEDQGLWASIRQGLRLTKDHLKETGLVWLVWMGIRLMLLPVGALILILLAPLLLLTLLGGVVIGSVPAVLVALCSDLFLSSATAWIMGALVGLPIFVLVMISPIPLVFGLVEVYLSCIWTLAYRDLRALRQPVQAPAPQPQIAPAPEAAD
jgi:hypothetical protein